MVGVDFLVISIQLLFYKFLELCSCHINKMFNLHGPFFRIMLFEKESIKQPEPQPSTLGN
jgi:hypothetical protein